MNKKILGVVIFALALLFGLQISMEHLFSKRLELMTETMAETETLEAAAAEPHIFAVFGIDQNEGDAGRSDCIMLASLGEDGVLRLCSIARDTLVTIPGTGEETKLGHAYAMGGPELALSTLNENFHLQLQDYVSVNFSQMEELVDLLGGVEVQLTEAEWKYLGLPKPYLGLRRLSGEEALRYSRIRSIDSDDVRTARQRKVVMAMLDHLKGLPRTELPELVVECMKLCRTNVDILTLMGLGKEALSGEIEAISMALPGDTVTAWGGKRKDGVWYYVYDLQRAAQEIDSFFYGTGDNTV